jgi:hypothetical protein
MTAIQLFTDTPYFGSRLLIAIRLFTNWTLVCLYFSPSRLVLRSPAILLLVPSTNRDAAGPRAGARGAGVVRAVQGGEPRGSAGGAPVAAAARAGAPDAVAGAAGPAVGGAASPGIPARVVPRRVPGGGNGRAPRRPPLRPPPSRPPRSPHYHHSLLIVGSRAPLQLRVPFLKIGIVQSSL